VSDDFERQLRRQLAETSHAASDVAFVARVSDRIRQRRRLHVVGRAGVVMALLLTAFVAAPYLLDIAEVLARLPSRVRMPVAVLTTSAGWAVSALAAAFVLIRVTGVAGSLRRRLR
jgi:hypothetical protein